MSVFTNPATGAGHNAAAYTAAVLELVGTRDPLTILRETPAELRAAIRSLSRPLLQQPESDGKWSIAHVLQHLADAEMVWGWRVRLILAQDRPTITGYDQDLWADRLGYAHADAVEAVHLFSVIRHANLRVIERASSADLQRVGVHIERGEESLAHMLRLNAGHDVLHLRQIERIRHAVTA